MAPGPAGDPHVDGSQLSRRQEPAGLGGVRAPGLDRAGGWCGRGGRGVKVGKDPWLEQRQGHLKAAAFLSTHGVTGKGWGGGVLRDSARAGRPAASPWCLGGHQKGHCPAEPSRSGGRAQQVQREPTPQPEAQLDWNGGPGAPSPPGHSRQPPLARCQQQVAGRRQQAGLSGQGQQGEACGGEGRLGEDRTPTSRGPGAENRSSPEALCGHLCVQVGSRRAQGGQRAGRAAVGHLPAGLGSAPKAGRACPDLPCSRSVLPHPALLGLP